MKHLTRKQIAQIAISLLTKYERSKAIQLLTELLRRENRTGEIEFILSEMARSLYSQERRLSISILSVRELAPEMINRIADLFKQRLNANEVTIDHTIDPSLKGGFIAKALDLELDTSIRYRIAALEAAHD